MTSYNENTQIDTSSIVFSKTGIRLLKFINNVFGIEVLEKVKTGDFVLMFNGKELKYNKNFRNRRVKEDTTVVVERNTIQLEIDEEIFA